MIPSFGFSFFGILFIMTWGLTIAVFGLVIGKIVMERQKNNRAPRLSLMAVVLDKRDHHSHHHGRHMHTTYSSTYYVTFAFDNGERIELCVPSREYGLMIAGDRGLLTFQGTRFVDFQRNAESTSDTMTTRRL